MEVNEPRVAYRTRLGVMWHGDSLGLIDRLEDASINACITSPPFALTRQKAYGNEREDEYISWFLKFAERLRDKLTDDGSLVIDLGGSWLPGAPIRSLYQYRLLIELVDKCGYYLAEDFYWWNRAKLPGPREWVNVKRTRVKDAVNVIWWLSKTPHPKADNRRVLRPYSASMKRLLKRGTYNAGKRHSEHVIGDKWATDHGGAIPPNVLEVTEDSWTEADNMLDSPNTVSNDSYLEYCRTTGTVVHPARFPRAVPEFFIQFLTEPGDTVLDIFAGSNMTGSVAEHLGRRWIACELNADYVVGSLGRFLDQTVVIENRGHEIGVRATQEQFLSISAGE